MRKTFFQERNIGPPDKDDEAERLLAAVARREAKEREEAAALGVQAAAGESPTLGAPASIIAPGGMVPMSPGGASAAPSPQTNGPPSMATPAGMAPPASNAPSNMRTSLPAPLAPTTPSAFPPAR
jgi:hypothetical protein